jgi:mannose-6-phosphate isomerase-like protein (cupin superfamily)
MDKYSIRKKLIHDAFLKSQNGIEYGPLEIENLIKLMKERSKDNEFLSSLYFAGCLGDHPFFLKNNKFAIGLAVLPEDSNKAGLLKSHTDQIEILVIIDGSILLEVEENHIMIKKALNEGDIYIINKNIKHKISAIDNQNSAFIFIKTNPSTGLNDFNNGKDLV